MATSLLLSSSLTNGNDHKKHSSISIKTYKPSLIWHVRNREGYNPLALYRPYDVAFLGDNRAVVVEGFYPYSRIQVLNHSGRCTASISQGEIIPFGITINNEGYMAVTDHRDRTVKFFSPNGEMQLSWKTNMFEWPDGIATTGAGHYTVTDWSRGVVSLHDVDGVNIREFNTCHEGPGGFSCPAYITVDDHQRILVTDAADHTVKVFDMSGKHLLNFGAKCPYSSPTPMKDPRGIAINKMGNILVAESGNNCISCYSSDGHFIEYFLTATENDLKHPWGLAVNDLGQVLLSEQKINCEPGLKLYQCYE